MKAKTALGAELVIPALGAALALYFFVSVRELAWEAKAMGLLVGALLTVLIAIQLGRMVRELAAGRASFTFAPLTQPRRLLWRRFAIVALCALFIFALPWLGLTLGLFLLGAALMATLGAGRWRSILAVSGAVAAGAYLLFVAALDARVPRGWVEQMLSALF